uniref:Putative secreted protein n=1 Tax=Ixodes ricinus TaxID=34613 RepID=A0A6B0UXN2_IXORI
MSVKVQLPALTAGVLTLLTLAPVLCGAKKRRSLPYELKRTYRTPKQNKGFPSFPKVPTPTRCAGALHHVRNPGPLSSLLRTWQAPFRPRNNLRGSRVPQVTLGTHRLPSRFRHDLRLTGSLVPVVPLKMGSEAVVPPPRRRPALLRSNRAHLLLHQRQKTEA